MNNKGFAISTILYGFLTMASLILMLMLSVMASSRKNSDTFVNQIEEELNTCVRIGTC